MRNVSVYNFDSHKKERKERERGKKHWRSREKGKPAAQEFLENYFNNQAPPSESSFEEIAEQESIDKNAA